MPSYLQTVKTDQIGRRLQTLQMVEVAARLTRHILDAVPDRLTHSQAVAARAEFFTLTVAPEDADLVVAAAWLHDIGYAPELRDTGFHPLDVDRAHQYIIGTG